jgi:dTDP-4-dehydrorhamnose reductase
LSGRGRFLYPGVHAVGREEADVTNSSSLAAIMAKVQPDYVINCAAITNVAYCEKYPEQALRVNAVGAGKAAIAARAVGAHFIQVSTDYVFPGYQGPYRTTDTPLPINAYGLSKRWGEQAVLALHPQSIVVRVGWLFGRDYPSSAPMLAESENYKVEVGNVQATHRANIWDDLYGNPTHVENVANILSWMVGNWGGVLHFDGGYLPRINHIASSEGAISWYEFLIKDYPEIRATSGRSWDVKRPEKGGLVPTPGLEAWSYEAALRVFRDECND